MIVTDATPATTPTNATPAAGQRPLPDGWRWVRLGDVATLIAGQSPPSETYRQEPSGLPFFQGKADFGMVHPVARVWCVSPIRVAEPGDILISVRAPVGPTNMADTRCCIGRGIAAIRPDDHADRDYIHYALQLGKTTLEQLGSGSTFAAISMEDLRAFLIPLPPLPEQRRIAAALRERLAAVERMRAAADAQLAAARALPAASLRAVFESDEARAWPRVRLGDIAKVQSGYAFKSEWFTDEGIKLLRNANVFQDRISWEDQVRLPYERRGEFIAYELHDSDIVLSLDRPLVSNGLKIARISQSDLPCLLLQRVARFQVYDDLDADFLYAFLHTATFISAITQHDQSLGVPHVSPKQVEAILIPCPTVSEQRRIATELRERMAEAERVSTTLQAQREAIAALPQALLRQAFAGEL